MYKLKIFNGRVNTLLKTENDYVKTNLSIKTVKDIIDTGEMVESDRHDYPICIDNKWYFEGIKPVNKTGK